MNEKKMRTVLSLFSGCGGMDLGFEGNFEVLAESVNENIHPDWASNRTRPGWVLLKPTGFKTVFANDIKETAKVAWTTYFGKKGVSPEIFHLGSVVDYVKSVRNKGKNIFKKNVDVLTGGFPCQDFSVAGKRKGFNSHKSHTGELLSEDDELSYENRGKLYTWMRDVIDIVKPKIFIAENVKGLANLANVKEIIEHDFKNIGAGYMVLSARVLHAARYGVPQTRERIVFIGFLKSALKTSAIKGLERDIIPPDIDPYPPVTHWLPNERVTTNKKPLIPYVTVRKALSDLAEPENSFYDLSQSHYSHAHYMGKHCQGQTEVSLDGLGPTIRSEHHGNIEYRRLSEKNGGKIITELGRDLIERRLSVRECARIQTFPDDFEFVIKHGANGSKRMGLSASDGYKLVGNAVPPLLAYHLADRLTTIWDKLFRG